MTNEYFCLDCMTHLTEHADGTMACSCSLRNPLEAIPARWVVAANDEPVTREMLDGVDAR